MTDGIEVVDVSVTFQLPQENIVAVDGARLLCREGEITGLIGESGSGKSVLGQAMLGLLPDNATVSGNIFYGGRNLAALSEDEQQQLRGKEIGFIPQNPEAAFDPLLTVGKQIGEALRVEGYSAEEARKAVVLRLTELGFAEPERIADSYSFELSGGMCQRALCVWGTICSPRWLIADEPTKGLDALVRLDALRIFRRLHQEGTSILLITHDLQLAKHLCTRVAVMRNGRIVEEGTTAAIFEDPQEEYTKTLLAARPQEILRRKKEAFGWND